LKIFFGIFVRNYLLGTRFRQNRDKWTSKDYGFDQKSRVREEFVELMAE